jgi:cytochrome P450
MIPDAVKISEELLDKIKHKDLNSIAIMHEYQAITAEVIGRIFFGERFSEYTIDDIPATVFLANSLSKIGREMLSPSTVALGVKFAQLGILKRHREMLKYIKKSREFCQKIVTQRMNEIDIERKKGYMPERQTLMDIFYNQRIEKPEDSFSDIEIVDEFITFFVTGMDTTGHLIAMASYYLLQHPQYKDRLLKEADHYFSDPSKVTIDTLTQMEFMGAFLKEALRMGTPTPFVFERIAIADHKLGDLDIKKGTAINTCFIANNFDETLHQDPNSFNPDRWITSSKTQETMAKNPFAFTPFSIGARNCIGQHLAMNEARIIFSLFLKKYNYELADKNYKLRMTFRAFYEPEDELIYRLTSNST